MVALDDGRICITDSVTMYFVNLQPGHVAEIGPVQVVHTIDFAPFYLAAGSGCIYATGNNVPLRCYSATDYSLLAEASGACELAVAPGGPLHSTTVDGWRER